MQNSPMNAGIYFFRLSPCSFTPMENNIPSVRKVRMNFRQNTQEASCVPSGIALVAAASPTDHVENFTAEKSNAFVRTAMHSSFRPPSQRRVHPQPLLGMGILGSADRSSHLQYRRSAELAEASHQNGILRCQDGSQGSGAAPHR